MTHQKPSTIVSFKENCQISKSSSKTKIPPRLAHLWWETSLPVLLRSLVRMKRMSTFLLCQMFKVCHLHFLFHLSTCKDFCLFVIIPLMNETLHIDAYPNNIPIISQWIDPCLNHPRSQVFENHRILLPSYHRMSLPPIQSPLATGENQPPRKERLDAKQPRGRTAAVYPVATKKPSKHPEKT